MASEGEFRLEQARLPVHKHIFFSLQKRGNCKGIAWKTASLEKKLQLFLH